MKSFLTSKSVRVATTVCVSIALEAIALGRTPQTSAFTYQGVLKQSNAPVNGNVDLEFRLFEAASAGDQIGATFPINAVSVADGVFSATLDFGSIAFIGDARWIEIAVRSPAGSANPFVTLAPRQKIESTPYAVFAMNAYLPAVYPAPVSFNNPSNQYAGVGTLLTGLNASSVSFGNLNAARLPTGGAWSLASTLDVDGGTFAVDATSNRVGMGTTSAEARLHVFDGSAGSILANGNAGLVVERSASSFINVLAPDGLQSGVLFGQPTLGNAAAGLQFNHVTAPGGLMMQVGGISWMNMQANGNVGVGNYGLTGLVPEAPLHVFEGSAGAVNPSSSSTLVLERSGANYLTLLAPDANESAVLFGNPTNGGAAGGILFNSPNTLNGLQFRANTNDTYMVVASTGNVGIGTTSPTTDLEVSSSQSTVQITSSANNTPAVLALKTADATPSAWGQVQFVDSNNSVTGRVLFDNQNGPFNSDPGIAIQVFSSRVAEFISGGMRILEDLTIEGGTSFTPVLVVREGDGDLIAFAEGGFFQGRISISGSTVSYNAFTGSHYGWNPEGFEMGTLMSMTGDNRRAGNRADSEVIYGVAPASRANDPACLGAYLGPLNGPNDDPDMHMVMAVGNGEMWVVDDGHGDIAPGDNIISSEVKGCGMKDDPARFAIGYVIARSAQRVTWSDVQPDSAGVRRARISVLFDASTRGSERPMSADMIDFTTRKDVERMQQRIDRQDREIAELRTAIERLVAKEK